MDFHFNSGNTGGGDSRMQKYHKMGKHTQWQTYNRNSKKMHFADATEICLKKQLTGKIC
jgi:hypothetical protein